jgi:DNA invertase Pin-like site-specific DNA recombinase
MLVGYTRVSTLDQNPALQITALKGAGCERIFTEKASGAQRDRPELKAALDYIRAGDTLVVWKLDRLARSMRQLIETVEDLHARGIELRSLTESIDTATPGGRLIFHIFGALAEFERAVIRERTSAGLAAARERGKKGGRPRTLGPKDLAAAKALLADPAIRVEDVAARLKVSPATLYRHLPGGRSAVLAKE